MRRSTRTVRFKLFLQTALFFLIACGRNADRSAENIPEVALHESKVPVPVQIAYTVIGQIPHDTSSSTQGLEIRKNELLESTGTLRKSTLKILDLATGNVKFTKSLPDEMFGEGLTVHGNKIYQLTWRNNTVFVWDADNPRNLIKTFNWGLEGWGIANDGSNIIISNGSSNLYFLDPSTFSVTKTIQIVDSEGEVDNLNELEFIEGYIYSNVWHKERILKIDPGTGNVVGFIDLSGLLSKFHPSYVPGSESVLNGIAWDKVKNEMYVTGKNWPSIFRIKIRD